MSTMEILQTKPFLRGKEIDSTTPLVVRPFKCYLCDSVFDRMSQLEYHKRSVHHQEKSHVCQICGKGFFRPADLRTHLNIHLGTNRCICEICGRKFNHVSNLIRHLRTHSGVKPYPCTTCGKRFTQINTLSRHKAIHNRGVESLSCCFCNEQYEVGNGLKEHMKHIHGINNRDLEIVFLENASTENKTIKRQHYCKICGESFQFVHMLRIHEKRHQNAIPLECRSCNKNFHDLNKMKEHRCEKPKRIGIDEIRLVNNVCDKKLPNNMTLTEIQTSSNNNDLTIYRELEAINNYHFMQSESQKIPSPSPTVEITTNENVNNNCVRESNKIVDVQSTISIENSQTKETIVYVTLEQLANMNTEQVVETANNFLHDHLMELAVEDLQTNNRSPRECDDETAVTDIINNYWKEIEISDLNKSDMSEQKQSFFKTNTPGVIYVHDSEKSGIILVNENGNVLSNAVLDTGDQRLEQCVNMENGTNIITNSVRQGELQGSLFTPVKQHNNIGQLCSLNSNTTETKSNSSISNEILPLLQIQTGNTYCCDEDMLRMRYNETESFPVASMNPTVTNDLFEELFTNQISNSIEPMKKIKNQLNSIAPCAEKSFSEEEKNLTAQRTDSRQQFSELAMTNTAEKSDNFCNSNDSSDVRIKELQITQNESMLEPLLKVVQLENGQRTLGLVRSNSCNESHYSKIRFERNDSDDAINATPESIYVKKSIETISNSIHNASRDKSVLQNQSETCFYMTENNRDQFIDVFGIDTLNLDDQNHSKVDLNQYTQDSLQRNLDDTEFPNGNKCSTTNSLHLDDERCEEVSGIQNSPPRLNETNQNGLQNGPIVRLVQNEDGAQFFELIHQDLELEEAQDFELLQSTSDSAQDQHIQLLNTIENYTNSHMASTTYNDNVNNKNANPQLDPAPKDKEKNIPKKYHCEVCKKSFAKGYNYKQHIGTHFADQQKFKCKECGKFFAWKSTLNKHMATHRAGGQQKFVCDICAKIYTTLSQVNEHVKRDHLKERNHKCLHCSKTFFKKFDLKIHNRTHTKERPYKCRVCHKSFHHQSHIIRHERIHSGERPYVCDICQKAFTQLGSLKAHRQRHQELKIDILDYQLDEDDPLTQTTL